MKKTVYTTPKLFNPSEEEVKEAMEIVSKFFSENKEIGSSNYPELKVRGKRTKL
jgi:hypothetical protein